MSHGAVVTDAIVAPCVVLWLLLPCCAWCHRCCCQAALCHGHGRHAMCGVTVTVVMLCSAVIAVVPCVVLQSWSSRRVLRLLSPRYAWCCRCCCQVALCRGHVRCHGHHCHAVWYCHHSRTTYVLRWAGITDPRVVFLNNK